ncbi:MAG TPA: hypothetical protein VI911_08015 [Patescibacteria group bacterium]|nr:hypothetical protein [Patescibacteria group bacterium]
MKDNRIKSFTKDRYQKAIRNVIKGLSRKVQVYKQPIKSECTNCYYDKMTDSSTGKCSWTPLEALAKQAEWEAAGNVTIHYKYFLRGRCPVCTGKGFLETQRRAWADCLITWDPSASGFGNTMTYTPAGTEGSTIVQLKTDPKYFDLFKNCVKIIVDGVDCKLSKPPLLRGLGNQSLLIITAFTTDKPKVDTTEIIKDYT